MGRSGARAVVLCEDRQHESFLTHLLERVGVKQLYFLTAPQGAGSAEQWVHRRLPDEAKKFRSQTNHQRDLALLVMVDGDRFGFRARKKSLDEALVGRGMPTRRVEERIAYLVPTSSIETWVAWLTNVDEQLAVFGEASSCKDDVVYRRLAPTPREAVAAWGSARAGESTRVPSLDDARKELKRIA